MKLDRTKRTPEEKKVWDAAKKDARKSLPPANIDFNSTAVANSVLDAHRVLKEWKKNNG